ncbi:hypothetical protein Tco_0000699 [Tanacetum coccineum]
MKCLLHPNLPSWLEPLLPSLGYGINVYPPSILTEPINDLCQKLIYSPGPSNTKYHKSFFVPPVSDRKKQKGVSSTKPVPRPKRRKPGYLLSTLFGLSVIPIIDRVRNLEWLVGQKLIMAFFIGYFWLNLAYKVTTEGQRNHETMHVSFDDLQRWLMNKAVQKPGLQSMTSSDNSVQTRSYLCSVTKQLKNQLKDVDELETQEHVQHQTATIADNVPNAMFDANKFVNPFATLSTSDVESSNLTILGPSHMHTYYQPIPIMSIQWTKDHPIVTSDREKPSLPVLTRKQLDPMRHGALYALTVSHLWNSKNVKRCYDYRPLHDLNPCKEELLQFKRLDVWC